MVVRIAHPISAELAEENRSNASQVAALEARVAACARASDYCAEFAASIRGRELLERAGDTVPLDVLDVGCGIGESSVLLAERGHRVACVEPSPEMCALLERVATRFSLPIDVYECTAEAAAEIPRRFDLCVFNSSLHHCDDPVRALQNCHALLRDGGRIAVVNEPLLRFDRSHAWFARRLQTHPVEMGHYGGNEHSYHFGEYVEMLRAAGFQDVHGVPSVRNTEPRLALEDFLWRKIDGQPVYGDTALLVRLAWFVMLKRVLHAPLAGRAATAAALRLSLVQTSFLATKA